jgi:hypothetical protein
MGAGPSAPVGHLPQHTPSSPPIRFSTGAAAPFLHGHGAPLFSLPCRGQETPRPSPLCSTRRFYLSSELLSRPSLPLLPVASPRSGQGRSHRRPSSFSVAGHSLCPHGHVQRALFPSALACSTECRNAKQPWDPIRVACADPELRSPDPRRRIGVWGQPMPRR